MLRRLPFYSPRPTHVPLILPDDLFPLLLHQIFYRSVMLWRVERQSVGVCRRGSLIEPGQVVGDEVSILAGGALDEDDALFVAYATEFVGRSMVAD